MDQLKREWKNVPGTPEAHEDLIVEIDGTEKLEVGDKVDESEVIAEWTRPDA